MAKSNKIITSITNRNVQIFRLKQLDTEVEPLIFIFLKRGKNYETYIMNLQEKFTKSQCMVVRRLSKNNYFEYALVTSVLVLSAMLLNDTGICFISLLFMAINIYNFIRYS